MVVYLLCGPMLTNILSNQGGVSRVQRGVSRLPELGAAIQEAQDGVSVLLHGNVITCVLILLLTAGSSSSTSADPS